MSEMTKVREPLYHISARTEVSLKRQILVRVVAVLIGLFVASMICLITYGVGPFTVISEIWKGNFGTSRKRWILFRDTALMLGVGLALIPAFKMKFWNLGGNGQILIGGLVTIACMRSFGGKMPDVVVWILMFVLSMLCSAIWAVIPAIFKAIFKTNESLFTLMMNYIASGLVAFFIKEWSGPYGSGSLSTIDTARLPQIGGNDHLIIIIFVAIICAAMFVYMKYSKHGYEIAVVGESENTARYVGINVKKVIIRTLVISGALCGIIGFLIAGAKDHTISTAAADNMGFTSIIAVWLAKMDPLWTIVSAFGIVFIKNGIKNLQSSPKVNVADSSVTDMIIGIMYFCLIGCEFFINYIINRKKKKKEEHVEKEASV